MFKHINMLINLLVLFITEIILIIDKNLNTLYYKNKYTELSPLEKSMDLDIIKTQDLIKASQLYIELEGNSPRNRYNFIY
jgi:hypothetical protein